MVHALNCPLYTCIKRLYTQVPNIIIKKKQWCMIINCPKHYSQHFVFVLNTTFPEMGWLSIGGPILHLGHVLCTSLLLLYVYMTNDTNIRKCFIKQNCFLLQQINCWASKLVSCHFACIFKHALLVQMKYMNLVKNNVYSFLVLII